MSEMERSGVTKSRAVVNDVKGPDNMGISDIVRVVDDASNSGFVVRDRLSP